MRKERDENAVDPNQPALIVTYGNTSRKRRPLDKSVLVLGRMQGCDMPLMSPDVAPVHCVIVRLADGWHIRDCSGHLGTRVNGDAVTEKPLADDDHLQIGPFNFKVFLPRQTVRPVESRPEATQPPTQHGPEPKPEEVEKLKQSRTNLARLALAYRNQAQAALNDQHELKATLERQARDNAAERRDIDRDWKQLEKSAQALRGRELAFDQAEKALQERVGRLEEELTERRHHAEDEVRLQRESFEADLARRRDELRQEARLLDEDRADLDRTREAFEQVQREFEEHVAALRAEQARATTVDTTVTQKLADLERENASLREQVANVPTQSHILRIEDTALRQARDEAREQLDKLNLVADALQRENEELRKKLTEPAPADTLVGAVPANQVARADLDAAEAAYEALQLQARQVQLDRERERRVLREQIEELRQENILLRMPNAAPTLVSPIPDGEAGDLRQQVESLRHRLVEVHAEFDVERQAWQRQQQAAPLPTGDKLPATEDEIRVIVQQIDLLHQENEELRRDALARQQREVAVSSGARSAALFEHQVQTLQSDLVVAQSQVREAEKEVAELRDQIASAGDLKTIQTLRQAVQRLQADLKDRDALIEKLTVELDAPLAAANLQNSGSYERELHQFRLELERDRRVLAEQLEDVRARQRDIEEAARETEVQLARERATIARERSELNRIRDEIRMDQERLLRLVGTGRPAAVVPSAASLRDALNTRKDDGNSNNGTSNNGTRRR